MVEDAVAICSAALGGRGALEQRGARDKLLAARKSLAEMTRFLEVDSLGFLSVEGLYWALEAGPRDPAAPQFTDHYFTGDYPTRLLDREIALSP
jgi:amidophosphoribosyltransferase